MRLKTASLGKPCFESQKHTMSSITNDEFTDEITNLFMFSDSW